MALILDSNQPALMSCRAGVGRAGVCRAGASISLRNLVVGSSPFTPGPTHGANAWTRVRAINPAHNSTPQSDTWTTVKEV